MPRSALVALGALSLTASDAVGQQRWIHRPESQPRTARSFYPTIEAPVFSAAEAESDVPFELSADPVSGAGYLSATSGVPDYLKGNPYRLSFWAGDYAPPASQRIDPALAQALVTKPRTFGYVMFAGRITTAKLRRVEALGVELDSFHTFQSYSAVIPQASLTALRSSADVRWVGYARPIQKIDPRLLRERANAPKQMFVSVFAGEDLRSAKRVVRAKGVGGDRFAAGVAQPGGGSDGDHSVVIPGGPFQRALERLGAKVSAYHPVLKTFALEAAPGTLLRMAALDFVSFIELDAWHDHAHEQSTRIVGVDTIRGSSSSNGSGTRCGILDSGFHFRNSANPNGHFDLAKWTWSWDFLGGGAYKDSSGHGTHVAGTFMGTGTADNRYRGCAPGVGPNGTSRVFLAKCIPGPSSNVISAITAFRSSAGNTLPPQVVNYSGGATAPPDGFYGSETNSRAVDTSVFSNKQLYCVAAGNSGGTNMTGPEGYGDEQLKSCAAPAVSKNAFAVASAYDAPGTADMKMNIATPAPFPPSNTSWTSGQQVVWQAQVASHDIVVEGFSFWTAATATTEVSTYLFTGTKTNPASTPVRTGTMPILGNPKFNFYKTTFSTPYRLSAGQYFYIGILTKPGIKTNTTTIPLARQVVLKSRSGTRGTWLTNSTLRPMFLVHCRVEVGETTATSSRGPTRDGRLKPNIVAPGERITSCSRTTNGYIANFGTSMASPHIAGIAADLMHADRGLRDRPALIKAILCAATNPYGQTGSFSQGSKSYWYRQGLGMADAYKALYQQNSSGGWVGARWHGTLSSSSAGSEFEWTVPRDADSLRIVLNFDEKAPSPGATRACLADLDLYVDVEPYSRGFNTGEYFSRRAWDTWEFVKFFGNVSALAGKRIKIKVYPRVRPAGRDTVDFGVGLIAQRGDPTPSTSLQLTAPAVVKAGADFSLSSATQVPAMIGTNCFVEIADLNGFQIKGLTYRTPDNLLRTSTSSRFTQGHVGFWYSSAHRTAQWTLNRATDGATNLCVRVRSDNRSSSGASTKTATYCRSICVDGTAPNTVSGLTSSTHTRGAWSNVTSATFRWNSSSDNGCAGIAGFATRVSLDRPIAPTARNLGDVTSQAVGLSESSGRPQYFVVRAVDRATNFSASSVSYGPIRIDTTQPVLSSLVVDGGATHTRDSVVGVSVSGTDVPSGVSSMRHSLNGTTWGGWITYSTSTRNLDLRDPALGGSNARGPRNIYAQVRDRAGNVSATRNARIIWDSEPPVVTNVVLNGGAAYTASLAVTCAAAATGAPTEMRYSLNGGTSFSTWFPYASNARAIDLGTSAWGGNPSTGTKRCWVQCRDAAGNVSTLRSDDIAYYRIPVLRTALPASIEVVHHEKILLTGSGLADVNEISFGPRNLTSTSFDDWFAGNFRIVNDTTIELFPPQAMPATAYAVRVANPGFTSAPRTVTVTHNTTRRAGCPHQLAKGKTIDILVHRGDMPANTIDLLTLSASPTPLNVPGLIQLGHGGNATTFLDPTFFLLSVPVLHDPANRCARWVLPALIRRTTYFAALMFDPANIGRNPIVTSTTDSCRVY